MASLSLVENELAPRGPLTVYMRVKDPDGIILTNSSRISFTCGDEAMVASASREVEYEDGEVDETAQMEYVAEAAKEQTYPICI